MDMSRAERILLERDRAAEAAKKREEKRQEEPDPEEDPPKEQPEAEPEPRKRQVKNRKETQVPTSHTFLARSFNERRGGWEEAVRVKKVLFREPPHYTKRRPNRTSGEVRSTWAVNTAEH